MLTCETSDFVVFCCGNVAICNVVSVTFSSYVAISIFVTVCQWHAFVFAMTYGWCIAGLYTINVDPHNIYADTILENCIHILVDFLENTN